MVFQILLSDKQMKPLFDKERIPPKRRLCLGKWADIDPVIGIAEVIGDVDPGLGNVIVFLYVFEQVEDFLAHDVQPVLERYAAALQGKETELKV